MFISIKIALKKHVIRLFMQVGDSKREEIDYTKIEAGLFSKLNTTYLRGNKTLLEATP